DFDPNVTLQAMLQPGDDRFRWSNDRAARIDGYLVAVATAKPELSNCLVRCDTHMDVALTPDAPSSQHVVVEISPFIREWAQRQGWDWSTDALQRTMRGRRVRIEGWLLWDSQHSDDSENTAPGTPENWRATAWEVHPITRIEVIE